LADATARLNRIGILGGSSDQATTDYYTRLNRAVNARAGGWNTAELLISSMNFAFSADCVKHEKWDAVGEYLAERAKALELGGADVLMCVSNTLHKVAPVFMSGVRIPLLHIVDPTARAIRARGMKRVALLGTKAVMSGTHITERHARLFEVEAVPPGAADQDAIDRIIFDELCRGIIRPESRIRYLDVVDRMRGQGCEGVILGCSEIPLLIGQADRPEFPMFDATALHVAELVDFAFDGTLRTITRD
jgi:aspartate racemase